MPAFSSPVWNRAAFGVVLALISTFAAAAPEPPRLAFLAAENSLDQMAPHNSAAWQAAQGLFDNATLLHRNAEGAFADTAGKVHGLTEFDVVWYHQGNAIERTPVYSGPSLKAIRDFAGGGGGILLSGGALAMVAQLGLEGSIRAQRRELDNFRDPAALIPEETSHPVFKGLEGKDGVFGISHGGCKAVADFYWGGPGQGMVLANTPDGVQRPLVEYKLGSGRVIVFGWRWPDYADTDNPFRANLLKLTSNLLHYLSAKESWRPVVIRSDYPPVAFPEVPGVAEPRWRALRMAIEDLGHDFPTRYPQADTFLKRLADLRAEHDRIPADSPQETYAPLIARFETLQREALLANPLLDFDRLLMIRRGTKQMGLPLNFHGNTDLPTKGYENSLVALSPVKPDGAVETLFAPSDGRFIGDLDLHYDAEKLLLSTPDANGRWGIAELDLGTAALTPLPLIDEPDVHNYDACYLPDGGIVFGSTAPFIGVPCVGGHSKVANLYLRSPDGAIRRLTNDQDHNWCPAVLNNGRILYQRWEYTDIAHAFTRLLFHANPDGSQQMEYYGSNSFWPTAMFYARPIPNHPTKIVTVVGGHHDVPREGELLILDPAQGRQETSGVVQRIPGYGKEVQPAILDGLISASWPRFLHPYPLSEKYFIVSCKPTATSNWGVYLVDTFDNFVLLHEEPGWAMLEPIPWRTTPRPPVVQGLADPKQKEATVLLMDVYRGPGLTGVPRGTVKALRVSSYNFTFHGLGGEPDRVGLDGPWDVRQILGTVPVDADGSANFRVPACMPIMVQPLDKDGKALALMRSWFTAAPGEVLSCVGCHEKQNSSGPEDAAPKAFRRPPSAIAPWYGPPRGFSFQREVQPVLDAYCIACHTGEALADGRTAFDLRAKPVEKMASAFQMHFTPSYMALRRWVHTPTLESDAHMLPPRAFHADTSKLVQILRDGHNGVHLSPEAWDRLITWIDLNAPFHGTWQEVGAYDATKTAAAKHGAERRRALHLRHAGIDHDWEAIHPAAVLDTSTQTRNPGLTQARPPEAAETGLSHGVSRGLTSQENTESPSGGTEAQRPGQSPSQSPFEGGGAKRRGMSMTSSPKTQAKNSKNSGLPPARPPKADEAGLSLTPPQEQAKNSGLTPARPPKADEAGLSLSVFRVEVAQGVSLELTRIEPGQFTMGSDQGYLNERPAHSVAIGNPFLMGRFEVTNQQYRCFDPAHDSRIETGEAYQFGDDERGFTLNRPGQPAVYVSWDKAMAFCDWLSAKTGRKFSLPTEAQWEYACRAGSTAPLWYGGLDDDFSAAANFSDATHHTVYYPHVPTALPPWRPADTRFDDTWRVSAPPGTFKPNPWGLFDMHGNVAEWTRSTYRPYPGAAANPIWDCASDTRRVVRGGSWMDRPRRARSAFRMHFEASQGIHDVGFRVVCEVEE